jgi:hypothetical protein
MNIRFFGPRLTSMAWDYSPADAGLLWGGAAFFLRNDATLGGGSGNFTREFPDRSPESASTLRGGGHPRCTLGW